MAPLPSAAATLAAFLGSTNPRQRTHIALKPNSLLHTPHTIAIVRPPIDPQWHPSALYATPITIVAPLKVASSGLGIEAIVSMSLLALQFGLQPSLTRKFTPKTINRSTVVFTQDIVKFFMAGAAILVTGGWADAIVGWNVRAWLTVAGIPALLYLVQNFATLIAYQNLSPLTFNVLNQTKTLSAALCCYLLMGKVQSRLQIVSLLILFSSACVIEKILPIRFWKSKDAASPIENGAEVEDKSQELKSVNRDNHTQGIFAVLLASFISGLAGSFTQKNLQSAAGGVAGGRNSYFFTMELCVVSLSFMVMSMIRSDDGKKIRENGFFHQWTPTTIIPILTNAAGGIVVGLVTKYAGSVKKGFALIFGLLLSGILQAIMSKDGDGGKISIEHVVGGCLAGLSLWMHSAFPAQ
jgi:UDP-sugar transporter A1/2/3